MAIDMATETVYAVTIYRADEYDAIAEVRSLGWWADLDFAKRLARREVANDTKWLSATVDEGFIEEYRTEDGIVLRDYRTSDNHAQWAIGCGDDGWWEERYQ